MRSNCARHPSPKRPFSRYPRCAVYGFAGATFGPATGLSIRVKQPETEHTVSVGKLQSWLDGGGKT
jgi:hypothetical protein